MKAFFGTIVLSLIVLGTQLQAASYTIPGTGVFDQELGTLDSVDVLIEPPETVLSEAGSHSHMLNPGAFIPVNTATGIAYANGTTIDFLPITLSATGLHTHSADVLPFLSSMGTIDFPSGTTSSDDSHFHTINFAVATVGAVTSGQLDLANTSTSVIGLHSHTLAMDPFYQTYSGAELEPFLTGSPDPTIDPPNTVSSTSGFHAHQLVAGSYQALINGSVLEFVTIPMSITTTTGGHTHSLDMGSFDVTSTTFHYTVPEPTTAILALAGIGATFLLRRRR